MNEKVDKVDAQQTPLAVQKAGGPPVYLLILVICGFVLAAATFTFLSKRQPKIKELTPQPVTLVEVIESAVPPVAEEEPSKEEAKPIPAFSLSGILFGDQGSLALINGRIVREGSMVEGAKLEKVSSDRVELSFEGRRIILRSH